MLLSLPLSPYTSAEPCAILQVSLPDGTYAGPDVDSWLDECWLLNLTGFSQTFIVRINNTSAVKRSYDTRLVVALNEAGYNNLQSLIVNGTPVPRSAFKFDKPEPYSLWDWPSGDVYPTWYEDTYVNVGTIYRKSFKSVVVSVIFSSATGIRMHFDAYGSKVSDTPCYSGYITHNGISEDSTVLLNAGASANQPPTASFLYTPSHPATYDSVTFNASGSYDPDGYIASYEWDFGDGNVTTATYPAITHTYANYGDFEVTLNVTDNEEEWDTEAKPITVENLPMADFWWTPTSPTVCENVTFDASISTPDGGVLISYAWDFRDGTLIVTESEPIIIHHYIENGTFTVTLNVTDSEGRWDTESKVIIVSPCTYYLTVKTDPLGILTIPGEGWYDNSTHVNLDAPAYVPDENGDNGQRYRFDYWDVDGSAVPGNPIDVLMTANHAATAHYVLQYLITFAHTGLDDTASNTVVTVDGVPKSFSDLPFLLWADSGSSVSYGYNSIVSSVVSGKRFKLDSIGSPPSPFTVTGPETITGHYHAQYYLTLTTDPVGVSTPSGEGWCDTGTYRPISTAETVDIVSGSSRYKFNGWTTADMSEIASPSSPSTTVFMDKPKTVTANYKTQYLVTFGQTGLDATATDTVVTINDAQKTYGALPNSTWFDSGTMVTYSYSDASSTTAGKRFVLLSVSGTSSPITVTSSVTVRGNYKTQYYLTITTTTGGATNPSNAGWYDAGTPVSVQAVPDTDYVLNYWELDGSPVGSANPYNVLMNSAHTLHAVFEYLPPPPTTYYLTVKTDPLGITSISGEGWYDEGSDVVLTAPNYVNVSTGTRYKFAYWDVDGTPRSAGVNPITVTMNANHTATAHYNLQYYLTVTSPYDTPTPTSGWFDAGASITASVTSPWAGTSGTRYVCSGWTGTGSVPASGIATSVAFTMNAPSSITWNWKTQYHLTVKTVPSGIVTIPGEGWYDESTTVPLTAPNVTGYEFRYWDVNGTPQGNGVTMISVTMNMPYTATAHYDPLIVGGSTATIELHLTHTWMGINSILAGAFCIAAFCTKKRRKRV